MAVPSADWVGVADRVSRLRKVAAAAECTRVILKKQSSISWLLGARSHVPNTLEATCFDVVLDFEADTMRIVVNAIEAPRLQATELFGLPADFDVIPWWEDRAARLPRGSGVGSDSGLVETLDLSRDITILRRSLDDAQQRLLRVLCHDAAAAATRAAMRMSPNLSEYEVAGLLSRELLAGDMDPIVLMVAGAERVARDRHPIPTSAAVGGRAMLVCCARRHGLVASVTRIVSIDPLSARDHSRYEALLAVESGFLGASVPGARLGDVLLSGATGYEANGFASDEWHRHHQGGYSGWDSREFPARPTSQDVLAEHQVVAWNPSGEGWKVEDTALVTPSGGEPLVHDGEWPSILVDGRRRPDVLDLS